MAFAAPVRSPASVKIRRRLPIARCRRSPGRAARAQPLLRAARAPGAVARRARRSSRRPAPPIPGARKLRQRSGRVRFLEIDARIVSGRRGQRPQGIQRRERIFAPRSQALGGDEAQAVLEAVRQEVEQRSIRVDRLGPVGARLVVAALHPEMIRAREACRAVDGGLGLFARLRVIPKRQPGVSERRMRQRVRRMAAAARSSSTRAAGASNNRSFSSPCA